MRRGILAAITGHPRIFPVATIALSLGLAACGGGGGGGGSSDGGATQGEVLIGLTDAAGDFASYTVDVTSVSLTHEDGRVIEALPLTTRVDFARYVELTELLTASEIPAGVYEQVALSLDYSAADIWVEDAAGDNLRLLPENLRDSSGAAVGQLTVSVPLQDHNTLLIAADIPASLTLDFDLNASHSADFSGAVPVVSVAPQLIAEVDADRPKPHRVRGTLQSVDTVGGSYRLSLQPFRHSAAGAPFGQLSIQVGDDTGFEIDGVVYRGDSGLAALAAAGAATATVAFGELNFNPWRFDATAVYAGSSLPNAAADAVQGTVVARVGDRLTLQGASVFHRDGRMEFGDQVELDLGVGTAVRRELSATALGRASVSVGQRLLAFGQLSGSAPGSFVLDTGSGALSLQKTTLRGTVADNLESDFTLDLQRVDSRAAAALNFAGTGATPADDAAPANYRLDISSLIVTGFDIDDAVLAKGFTRDFGGAPKDFEAESLVDLAQVTAVLVVDWGASATGGIASLDGSDMTLDLAGHGAVHHLSQYGVHLPLAASDAPLLAPDGSGLGLYEILHSGARTLHTNFTEFSADLQPRLAAGAAVRRVVADGSWDEGELLARRIGVSLE